VQEDIAERKVTPGRFFVLKFDFSPVNRNPNILEADRALKLRIANSLIEFYDTYAMYWPYWGRDVDELIKKIDLENPAESSLACVRSVARLLKNAREKGDRRLADIQGVSIAVLLIRYY
jgi:hypothetical protein